MLGTPVGKEDRNSETLRSMLLASDVANDAVYTWMGQYYEFDSWDELLGDEDRCKVMMANELLWRALSASGVAMGKTVATLAGLSCSAYDDMSAVAASSTAMTAVAASYGAVAAVYGSAVAVDAVKTNETAWATLTGATSAVMGKAVAVLSGLNPDSYADMTAVASSSTAMAAVIANATALNAVVSSSTAMTAVASSQTAMAAVAASQTAMTAIAASTEALKALNSSSLKKTYTVSSAGTNSYVTVKSGNLLVLSLIGTGSNMWTAKGFTVPNTGNITFNTTAVTLCKTANNLQVAYGSSSTSQTATITGIPV